MNRLNINELKKKYKGVDDELLVNAEMLIRFFNFWPKVQMKWLKQLGFMQSEIKKLMKISDKYAKNKVKFIKKIKPKNRKQVIMIENDSIESLYKPRALLMNEPKRELRLKAANEFLKKKYGNKAVIMNPLMVDKFEKLMNEKRTGVDYMVITDKEIIPYQIEQQVT